MTALGVSVLVSIVLGGLSVLVLLLSVRVKRAIHAWRWRRRIAYRNKVARRVFGSK